VLIPKSECGFSSMGPPEATGKDRDMASAANIPEHGVGHLVVLDPATQRPVGIISTLDSPGWEPASARRDGTSPHTYGSAGAGVSVVRGSRIRLLDAASLNNRLGKLRRRDRRHLEFSHYGDPAPLSSWDELRVPGGLARRLALLHL
jgi:hypothetical protein